MLKMEEKVENLIAPIVYNLGYELYDVQYVKEGKDYYLRVIIDKEDGITLEDCEIVSNSISDLLDDNDFIKQQYFLEVSSAGIEKILRKDKHFEANIGNEIEVKLYKQVENKKSIIGILKSIDKEFIVIISENKEIKLDRKNIAMAKTIYNW